MNKPELGDPELSELFEVYLFCTAVNDHMLEHSVSRLNVPEMGELLGLTTALGQEAAKLAVHLTSLRRDNPAIYQAWVEAAREARAFR